MRRQKKTHEPASPQAPASGGGGSAQKGSDPAPAWSPPGGSTSRRRRPSLRADTANATRDSQRVSSYPQPGAGAKGDPNRKSGQPKTTSYPQTAGNVGHRGYQSIN